jgi:hypothetical protein
LDHAKFVIVGFLLFNEASAQDVEQAVKQARSTFTSQPIGVSGSIGASDVVYQAQGIAPRRDPHYWVVNANLNLTLFEKVSVPFSAVITQQDKNLSHGLDRFSQPFNQFGLSPKYKWLTLHGGYRSMDFSEYTLNGTIFLGGGIEINPAKGIISGSAMYGRFVKAVPKGGVDGIVVSLPAYERTGGAGMIRLGKNAHFADFIFLRIKDDIFSIPFDSLVVSAPHENQIIALRSRQRISRWMSAAGDISYSMFTKNLFEDEVAPSSGNYFNSIFSQRPSTQYNKALNLSLEFDPRQYKFGLRYKRIDPDYRSLGAMFLTNDVEEISINGGFTFFQSKFVLQIASGIQRNNLDQIQALTSQRLINSAGITINATDHLNLNGSYSDFSSNTLPVRNVFNDSIRFVQITRNGNAGVTYSFGSSVMQTISAVGTYQQSKSSGQPASDFTNATLSWMFVIPRWSLNFSFSGMYNQNLIEGFGGNEGAGPGIQLQKGFFRSRLRFNAGSSLQIITLNRKPVSENLSANAGIFLAVGNKQSLRVDCSWIDRNSKTSSVVSFSEFRGNVGYLLTFTSSKSNKKEIQK